MNDNDDNTVNFPGAKIDHKKTIHGTPREALLKALSECDNYQMVTITMARYNSDRDTTDIVGISAGCNLLEAGGLVLMALDRWLRR